MLCEALVGIHGMLFALSSLLVKLVSSDWLAKQSLKWGSRTTYIDVLSYTTPRGGGGSYNLHDPTVAS